MKSTRFLDSRVNYLLLSAAMLVSVLLPGILPVMASAALVTTRSITLSSSAAAATGVSYKLTFTPATTAASGVVIVDFCDDSPVIGQACNPPTGFDTAGLTSSPAGATSLAANTVKVSKALTAATPATITFIGLHNPTSATTSSTGFYARVVTYTDSTAAADHNAPDDLGTYLDAGGIALAITNSIGVSASVRETMTFCVSKAAPTANCGGTSTPAITLGHGTPAALDSTATDTDISYAQLSTNAASGAVVNMTNNNACGGLKRASPVTTCDIAPANTGNAITLGTAYFGMKVGTPNVIGSGTVTPAANYSTGSNYGMTYDNTNASGVTSPYGDTIFSSSAPVNNINVPLTFGASASNATPAGSYTATMNLVATGTY